MSVHTLEAERQQILERMQARREHYRHALANGEDIGHQVVETHLDGTAHPPQIHRIVHDTRVSDTFPRSSIMRTLMDHPVLCAAGVAAVFLIGPKRIARTVTTGMTTLTTLTARNQSNADMLGRLITMAGAYMQGRTNQDHQRQE